MNQHAKELASKVDSVVGNLRELVVILESPDDRPGRDELALIDLDGFRRAGCPVATSGDTPGSKKLARVVWIRAIPRGRTVLAAKVKFKSGPSGDLYYSAAVSGTLRWSIVTGGGTDELVRIEARHPGCRRQPPTIS